MKLVIATYFVRMQQINEFHILQNSRSHKRYHEKDVYSIDKLALSWQNNLLNNIDKL